MNEKDREYIKNQIMLFVDYSLDELENVKTLITNDMEHCKDREDIKYFATQIIELTIRSKKELEYKL